MISKYLLESAIAGGCSVVVILRAFKTAKDQRNTNRISQFFCRSFKEGQCQFWSSEMLLTVQKSHVSGVAAFCGKHGHIEKKEADRHMCLAIWNPADAKGKHPANDGKRSANGLRID